MPLNITGDTPVRKLPSRKLLATLIAGALFVPNIGFTLGLGEIEVNSALNQRLNADIELLSATTEDAETIIVKLASRKEFSRAGLDRPYLLNDLRFKSEVIDGVPHIKVSSGSPIREPFLNFLVEIDWPNGHMLREYTVLLDPPVFMTQTANLAPVQSSTSTEFRPTAAPLAAPAARPMVQMAPASNTVTSGTEAANSNGAKSTFIPAPVVQQKTPTNKSAVNRYRVKSGDTAWSLADKMRPNQNVTVPQMLMALLNNNPESFINGNVNGLKRGYILRAPDAAMIAAISKDDARAMVREHGALWRQYLQAKSGVQSAPAMATQSDSASAETAASSAANDAVSSNNAQLSIIATGGTSTTGGKDPAEMTAAELRAELALARERVETERVEKEELKSRISALEQNPASREGILAIEDKELANVQSLNAPVETEIADQDAAEIATDMLPEKDESATAGESVETTPAENVAEEESAIVDQEPVSEMPAETAIFADEATGENNEISAVDNTATMPADVEPVVDDVSTESAAGPLEKLLNNPTLLAVAGGGLLLIFALIALINKRRKEGGSAALPVEPAMSSSDDLESIADDIAETAAMTGSYDEMGAEVSAIDEEVSDEHLDQTEVTEAPVEQTDIDEESRDDVLAEADVYLAYGIYQQAEDLLKQALLEHSENDDYRVKLAETYHAGKNVDGFLEVASELKQRVNEDSDQWNKVMVLGKELCADDEMFKDEMVADFDMGVTSTEQLSPDFGTEDEAPIEELVDVDSSLDSDALELPDSDSDDLAADVEDESVEPETLDAELIEPIEELIEPGETAEEIEFDLSDTGAVEEGAVTEDEFSLDIDASELDIAIDDEAVAETGAEEESFELGDIELNLDEDSETVAEKAIEEVVEEEIDIDFNLDDVEEESAEAETVVEALDDDISLDLSEDEDEEVSLDLSEDVSLDLSDEAETESMDSDLPQSIEAVTAANDSSDDDDFDLSSLDDTDEISTKLDLARAYLDMGDHDGTRDILDEVLADGNDDQKQEANDLMQKLN